MWVIVWEDQTCFGPFYSIDSAASWMEKKFGPNRKNMGLRMWAVEAPK